VFSLIQPAEDAALNDETNKGHAKGRQNDGHPVTGNTPTEHPGHGVGHKRPDHVKRTVSNVGNSQHTENEAQAGGNDKKDHGSA